MKRTESVVRAAAVTMAAIAAGLAGCDRSAAPSYFTVLRGVVKSVNQETGELSVEAMRRTRSGQVVATEYCLLTKDSEIYINDRFSAISQVLIGDEVELIGCRDASAGVDRFHVTYAHFNRPVPPAPPPLVAATPASATRPASKRD